MKRYKHVKGQSESFCPFYVGEYMAHEYAKGFYASRAWHDCREGYILHRQSIDGGLCEECREVPGFIVHHKERITARTINNPDVTLSWNNLEYVCKACHDRIHDYCDRAEKRDRVVTFDACGNPIEGSPPSKE